MSVEVEFTLEVKCETCGYELESEVLAWKDQRTLYVEPCEQCIGEARREGRDE
jgi:hypothetical protein